MKHLFPLPACYLLLLQCLFASLVARAQAPTWQSLITTTQASGVASAVTATAADSQGNVYVAGEFQGNVSFGSISLTSPPMPAPATTFLAKWTPGMGFRWVQKLPVLNVTELAVEGTAVYITGAYVGSAAFGAVTLTSAGEADGYVARLTDAGNTSSFTWATSIGSTRKEQLFDIAVSGTSLFVVGGFESPTLIVGSSTLTNAGATTTDAFVAKLTDVGTSGTLVWAQRAGGTSYDVAGSVAVRGTNVYIGGLFNSASADFGSTTLRNASTTAGVSDAFVAKLTDTGPTSGSFGWAQRISGSFYDQVVDLAVSADGVYVLGSFTSPALSVGTTILNNASTNSLSFAPFDLFITKLTDTGPTGTVTWAYRAGDTGSEFPAALAVNGPGVYVAGSFSGATASFGGTTLTNANPSGNDVFVTKLLDAGSSASFVWAQRAGGRIEDEARSLTIQGSTLYVGGVLVPASTFGSQTATTPAGFPVAFLASLTDLTLATTPPAWATGLQVYPNPARNTVTLHLPALAGSFTVTLALLDALGRAVYTQLLAMPAGGLQQEIDLRSVTPGMYTLRIQADRGQAVRQLLVE